MKKDTRRELLKRLTVIAAAGYVAPKVLRIDTASAQGGPSCSNPPCK